MFSIPDLPSVPLGTYHLLPSCDAVYFVTTPDDAVVYVGKTMNLFRRLRGHNRMNDFIAHGCSRVAWIACEWEEVDELERTAILHYRPVLNTSYLGKRSNPDYKVVHLWLDPNLVREVKVTMLETHYDGDFSDLCNELYKEYLAERTQ